MKKFLEILCGIICLIFDLLVVGGVLILIAGVLMYLINSGTDIEFYKFFNDSPLGWAIMFGSVILGVLGRFVTYKIMDRCGISPAWASYEGGGSAAYSDSDSSDGYSSDSSYGGSSDDSGGSTSSSWPYEYGTMRDPYGNETEITHNTITGTYTDSYGHEYKSDDGGSTFYEVDDD